MYSTHFICVYAVGQSLMSAVECDMSDRKVCVGDRKIQTHCRSSWPLGETAMFMAEPQHDVGLVDCAEGRKEGLNDPLADTLRKVEFPRAKKSNIWGCDGVGSCTDLSLNLSSDSEEGSMSGKRTWLLPTSESPRWELTPLHVCPQHTLHFGLLLFITVVE